jgi:ribosomal-protein-alanine N-acetyltransferase
VASGDIDAAWSFASDPECFRFLPIDPPATREEELAFLQGVMAEAAVSPRLQWQLAITRPPDDELLGMVRIGIDSEVPRSASIGYGIRRAFWGQGLATEAAQQIVEFGFRSLGLHRIWATYDPDNVASLHVLDRIGMRKEGVLRHHRTKAGLWRDSVVCSILADEHDL